MPSDIVARAMQQQNWAEALRQVEGELLAAPEDASLWHLKGTLLERLGHKPKAIPCYNRAVQCRPGFAQACDDLARLLEESGQWLLAIQVYQHLIASNPSHPAAEKLVRLRSLPPVRELAQQLFLQANQQFHEKQFGQAEMLYRNALIIMPDSADIYCNLGVALQHLRRLPEARQMLDEAIKCEPHHVDAWNNYANVCKELSDLSAAEAAYRKTLALRPEHIEALINLGKLLREQDKHEASLECFDRALRLNPNHPEATAELLHRLYHVCQWERVGMLTQKLEQLALGEGEAAVPFIAALYLSPLAQRKNALKWAKHRFSARGGWSASYPLPSEARGDGVLRVGYLSSDFHHNATAFLISELFECHDRSVTQVFAYSSGPDDASTERQRIMAGVDRFVDIRMMSDMQAAQCIADDGIDILVDLKGYTFGHRLGVCALRPAPIQVHYLGYPGTLGAPFIDYFITDAIASPEGADAHFTEKLVRLSGSYQINDRARPTPLPDAGREAHGLPPDAFVFCNFNQVYKTSPAVFATWMRLLRDVPGSVLWLFESVAGSVDVLRGHAVEAGIDPRRLVAAFRRPLAAHISRYQHADLVLDTSPVCGHTTTSDALWAGAPVVALMGEHFASRVSGSLLAAVGLKELAVNTLAEYEALAKALASDKPRLALIRRALEQGRGKHVLFDAHRTARELEESYSTMARFHRSGQPPAAITLAGVQG